MVACYGPLGTRMDAYRPAALTGETGPPPGRSADVSMQQSPATGVHSPAPSADQGPAFRHSSPVSRSCAAPADSRQAHPPGPHPHQEACPSCRSPPRRPTPTWAGPDTKRRRPRQPNPTGQALYRIPEAMRLLGLSRSVIYKLISSGRLRSVKEGTTRLIPAEAIAEYVALLEAEAESDR